ncbi:hypothetical protein A2U01_0079749, partial [Trifolium medium]|nr:hypothetical protein [Trifolium medium]
WRLGRKSEGGSKNLSDCHAWGEIVKPGAPTRNCLSCWKNRNSAWGDGRRLGREDDMAEDLKMPRVKTDGAWGEIAAIVLCFGFLYKG